MIARALIVAVAVFVATSAAAGPDLLPPDKAYRVESRQVGQSVVEFDYLIAPGYILYKDRFSAELVGASGRLELELPPAQSKFDQVTKHQIDFYRDRVTVRVKLPAGQTRPTGVTATAQGCAVEAGVCYPPVKSTWLVRGTIDVEAMMGRSGACDSHAGNKTQGPLSKTGTSNC